MGSRNPEAFKTSATGQQPPEMALSYADILKIFQLENPYLYDHPKDDKEQELFRFAAQLMGMVNIDSETLDQCDLRVKVDPQKGFFVFVEYITSPQQDSSPTKHSALFMGKFHDATDELNNPVLMIDLCYMLRINLDQKDNMIGFRSIWTDIDSNNPHSYQHAKNINEVHASLCYANELFVQIITGQVLNDDSIKSAQAWFTKNPWEHAVQIGICLDRQPNAIFNAGAEIIYRQQMGERPQDIYPTPERKQ